MPVVSWWRSLPTSLLAVVVLLSLSSAAWGYGGGGGGAEDNDLFPTPTAPRERDEPPQGFAPPVDPGKNDALTGLDPFDTTSVDSGDSMDDLEEAISRIAQEQAKNPPARAMTPRQRIKPHLDSLPPDVRQRLVSQFTPEEILTTIRIDNVEDMIAKEKDPIARSVLVSALVGMKADHARAVAARRKEWDKRSRDAVDMHNKSAKVVAGIVVGAIPGIGPVLSTGISILESGEKGAQVSAGTMVLTAAMDFNPLIGAVVGAVTSEALSQAYDSARE